MKKQLLLVLTLLISIGIKAQDIEQVTDPVEWVNPLMGTDSKPSLSNGNLYPAIVLPWGMNCWMPQTGLMGNGWAYTYAADKIRGFKQTHQPSPWMNDYGQFSIMPVTRKLRYDQEARASWFSHKAEIAKPYYYKVYLADHNVTTEITPTERAASFRFTFPQTDSAYMVVDAFDKGSSVKILPAERKITGYTTRNSGGVASNFRNYFVLYFDKPFTYTATWRNRQLVKALESTEDHVGAVIGFKTRQGEQVNVRVASSFISPEQAELNLQREIGQATFETIQQRAKAAWNKELSRIQVKGGSADKVKTFYSCLYRSLQFPRKFYELDARNQVVHYSPHNGQVMLGYFFTDTGFWDTFRALFPFLNVMYPSLNSQIQQGLVNGYKEGGWLPEWASPGLRNVMVGSNSASIVADAYIKGVRGYDINTLYEAILKNTENEGPLDAVGRRGVKYYNQLGYVPYDVNINENAARTLEYAFDDFNIYQLAKALNRPQEEIDRFAKRSQNYRNLFDPETRLMRGKNQNGKFMTPFNPFKWGDAFTEGNSWHYSWSVFQDVKGLATLMGGTQSFTQMLDSVFTLPPVFDESYYGSVIHEIREMQIMNMGQYAHGNQPIQHMIYLYNYGGQPWKTQYWVRQVMDRLYLPTPDGYCGDEDNGQTSAWYVFSAMGFYPVTPGTTQYVLGTPLFREMDITLQNGKHFKIKAPQNSAANLYVDKVKLNGKIHYKNWIDHQEILKGGTLRFTMSSKPNTTRGTEEAAYPYSYSDQNK